jgi:hypothetical protein
MEGWRQKRLSLTGKERRPHGKSKKLLTGIGLLKVRLSLNLPSLALAK